MLNNTEKKPIYVILRSGMSGGTGTLSLRMGKWLISNGYEVLYICQEFNDENNLRSMIKAGITVRKWNLQDIASELNNSYDPQTIFRVITYSLSEFLFVEKHLKRMITIENYLLYAVHTYGLIQRSSSKAISYLLRKYTKRILKRIDRYDHIVYMENDLINETDKYYHLSLNKNNILRLPIHIDKAKEKLIYARYHAANRKILAIARAEFPFKGYLFGLIDDFAELQKDFPHLLLEIVTGGKDVSLLEDKLSTLNVPVRKKIKISENIQYDGLYSKFEDAFVYVGMGTTLLDACNYSVPAIVVQSYTYNNMSSGYFYQSPEQLRVNPNDLKPANGILRQALNLTFEDYEKICIDQHDILAKYYDIDKNMGQMLQLMDLRQGKMHLGISVNIVLMLQSIQKTFKQILLKKKNNSDKFIYDRNN